MMDLSSFKVLKEDDEHYVVGHPNGKSLKVKKAGLNDKSKETIKRLCMGGKYAEGGAVMPDDATRSSFNPMLASSSNAAIPAQESVPLQDSVQVPGEVPQALMPTPEPQPQSPPPAITPDASTPQGIVAGKQVGMVGALEGEKAAKSAEAKAIANQGFNESKEIANTEAAIAKMPTQQQLFENNQAKSAKLLQAYQDIKVDPDRVWKNASTGSKMMAGIAMILGGIGGGLTHTENPVATMMKDLIDRDVEAQKNDKSNAMNAWKMNHEALGNELAASLATQNQMYTSLKYKLMKTAAQAQGPVALARAQEALSQVDQKIAQSNFQLSLINQGLGIGNGEGGKQSYYSGEDPSILVPNLIKDPSMQAKAFAEIEAAQNTKKNAPEIMAAFDQAAKEQSVFSKNIIPGVNSPYINELMVSLGPTFQDIEGTVRQSAMDNVQEKVVPKVGDSDETIAVKRKALEHYLKSKQAAPISKGHGIDLSKFSKTAVPQFSQNEVVQKFMRQNPNVPNEYEAIKILRANGKL